MVFLAYDISFLNLIVNSVTNTVTALSGFSPPHKISAFKTESLFWHLSKSRVHYHEMAKKTYDLLFKLLLIGVSITNRDLDSLNYRFKFSSIVIVYSQHNFHLLHSDFRTAESARLVSFFDSAMTHSPQHSSAQSVSWKNQFSSFAKIGWRFFFCLVLSVDCDCERKPSEDSRIMSDVFHT